jgi:DNA-binding NtrC family response regulator
VSFDDVDLALASIVDGERYDAVLVGLEPDCSGGAAFCGHVAQVDPTLPVIITATNCTPECVVAMIRAGASDFLTKPFELDALGLALERAVQHRGLRQEVRRLRAERLAGDDVALEGIVGRSRAMEELRALVLQVAASDASVVIVGETGSGKELVARAIHHLSSRSAGPLVAVNCGAISEALLESELFGHTRGAFTGAHVSREGLMQHARGGVLFLDEVAAMPPSLQANLLRALQEKKVRPVGSDQETPIDFRLVSASNVELEEAVNESRFREDLLYRIQVIRLRVPPLRERGNDVLQLAQLFLEEFAAKGATRVERMSTAFAEKILAYDWPGNVRQLRNCMERAVTLTSHTKLVFEDLPLKVREYQDSSHLIRGDDVSRLVPLEQIERHYIFRVLEAVGGNKARAARILGVNRKTLYRRLQSYTAQTGRYPRPSPISDRFPSAAD